MRPFLELVGETDSLPICLDLPSGAVWILLLCLFYFKRFIPTPWIFAYAGFSVNSDLSSLLRVLLRSWGSFDCSMSPMFLEGAPKLLETFLNCDCSRWLVCNLQYPRWFSALFLLLSNVQPIYWRRLCGIMLVPQLIVMTGAQKFSSITSLWLQAAFLEVWYLTSVFNISWQRRFRQATSILSNVLFGVAIFSHFMWRREYKIEIIEEFVSNFLRCLNRLTLSHSEFEEWHTLYLWIIYTTSVGVVWEVIRLDVIF